MASFTWRSLIERARAYIDDDHHDEGGVLEEDQWLVLFNVVRGLRRREWIRMGLVSPAPVDHAFTGYTVTIPGVLVTIGAAEDLGNGQVRMLSPAQADFGVAPFWGSVSTKSAYWEAHGEGDELIYTLEPRDTSGNYFVRYLATMPYETSLTELDEDDETVDTTLEIPDGTDELLVLDAVRKSNLKSTMTSTELLRQIQLHEADIRFEAFGKAAASPRIRSTRSTPGSYFPRNPLTWRWR